MSDKFDGDDYHTDYPNPPKKYESTKEKKLQDRVEKLEWALKVSLDAMQKNIAYYSKKDEYSLMHGIEAALSVLHGK